MSMILKKDCSLVIHEGYSYIKNEQYFIPISQKGAIFLSLLNGKRSVEEVVNLLIDIGLCTFEKANYLRKNVMFQYKPFLMEDDFEIDNDNRNYDTSMFLNNVHNRLKEITSEFPRVIVYHVTSSCDKACRYCFLDAKKGTMEPDMLSYDELISIINEAAKIGVYLIAYAGGEPFLRKDLIDIILYASNLGISSHITTKYYLDEKKIKKLSKAKNLHLYVSYDCHIDEIASYLVGSNNHAKKMATMIKSCVDNKISLTVVPVVTRLTVDYYKEFLEHLEELGVKSVELSRYSSSFGRNDDELIISDKQWEDIIELSKKFTNINVDFQKNVPEGYDTIAKHPDDYYGTCVNGRFALPVLPNGKVVICDELPNRMDFCFGDLKKQSIVDVWNSDKRRELVFPGKEMYRETDCFLCEDFDQCVKKRSCIYASLLESGTANIPTSEVRIQCKNYVHAKQWKIIRNE